MLRRKIWDKINNWKSLNKKTALLIDGARQVGKSYIIEKYCKNNFKNYYEIDLKENLDAQEFFNNIRNKDDFFLKLSILLRASFSSPTCFFIDSVQYGKQIFDIIKYAIKDSDHHFILSGSLLGVELADLKSWPVGYISTYTMYPLDFEEYLWARGISEEAILQVKSCYDNKQEVDSFIHNQFLSLFVEYL
jgi:predicted AAA+ superfamily ATPase